jgi:hypothetical protein
MSVYFGFGDTRTKDRTLCIKIHTLFCANPSKPIVVSHEEGEGLFAFTLNCR